MFKTIRIAILLFLLAAAAVSTWRAKNAAVEWKYPLIVNLYPLNGDASAASDAYIKGLNQDDFQEIGHFMREEANRYGRQSSASIEIRLQPALASLAPAPPEQGTALDIVWWSLKLRWWAYQHAETTGPGSQVKLLLVYFDPARNASLARSTALQKGMIGRINVFALRAMARQNNVVIAHEFLHTLGATDKYDIDTGLPAYPDGYGEPDRLPLLPQQFAEIMGGRLPRSEREASIPLSLDQVLIGNKTAQEINWQ